MPQAIDSTMTRPNGSGHWIGKTVTERPLEQVHLLVVRHLADVLDVVAEVAAAPWRRSAPPRACRASCRRASAAGRPRARSAPRCGRPCRATSGRGRAGSRRFPGRRGSRRGRWRCGRWQARAARAAASAGRARARSGAPAGTRARSASRRARARRGAGRGRCGRTASRSPGRARTPAAPNGRSRRRTRPPAQGRSGRGAGRGARGRCGSSAARRSSWRACAFVWESPAAKSVTSWPRSTRPSARMRDDPLDAAVAHRRHREPGRCEERDPHRSATGMTNFSAVWVSENAHDLDVDHARQPFPPP